MSGRLGGAFAPGLVVGLAPLLGWRGGFYFFAAIGCIWAALFWFWFRDNPEEKSGVTEEELKIIRDKEGPFSFGAYACETAVGESAAQPGDVDDLRNVFLLFVRLAFLYDVVPHVHEGAGIFHRANRAAGRIALLFWGVWLRGGRLADRLRGENNRERPQPPLHRVRGIFVHGPVHVSGRGNAQRDGRAC